jgi:rhodanese-related sulfurtransferase
MIRIWLVVTALMLFVGAPVLAAVASNIAPPAAKQLLKERKNVYLLDVRTLGEYQQMRLADAHLIPIDQVMQRIGEIPQDRPVVVYCAVGSRSAQVFNYLARRGYREVYNLEGGIYAWAQSGYPVLKGRP